MFFSSGQRLRVNLSKEYLTVTIKSPVPLTKVDPVSAGNLTRQHPEEFGKLALAYQDQRDTVYSLEDLGDKAGVSKDFF